MDHLSAFRVIDLTTGIPGAYCTKLFADAGADVVKVESANGDPLRRWSASGAEISRSGALFRYLHHGKRSVTGEATADAVDDLVTGADLVVESLDDPTHRALTPRWRSRDPGLVVLSITPYGRSGPYAGRPASHFTIEAEAGSLAMRGREGMIPFQAGGRLAYWVAGAYAAVAALACLRRARRTCHGEAVDCSIHEAMTISGALFMDMMSSLLGRPTWSTPPRTLETPSIEPTADGWVGFNTNTRQQWEDFCVLIGRADLIGDEGLASAAGRMGRFEEWNEVVHTATRERSTADLVDAAAALRIPVAPVCNGASVIDQVHFVERGVFVDAPDGEFRQPRPPYLIDGESTEILEPAPEIGEHDGTVAPRSPTRPSRSGSAELPLDGIHIVDFTNWWAGPAASHMLAVLGADVLKIESVQRPDGMRYASVAGPRTDRWWEQGFMFLSANSEKRGITLDLTSEAGRDTARSLIARADAVVENFSPRVMEQFGLDWEAVHVLNPRTVMVRMPAFGLDGPWRDHVGFAQTMEQFTGMAWTTGHVDDQPRIPRGPCDPNAGMHAVFALLIALERRDRQGEGCLVEAPMIESALNVAAEQVVEFTAYGAVLGRDGNRSPDAAPQGLYRCAGDADAFVALSVTSGEQWNALRRALGHPKWAADPKLQTLSGRRADHDELDVQISAWCSERTPSQAVEHLVAHGVPAAELTDTRSTSQHPQHRARRFYEELDHPVVGRHPHPTAPFRFASVDRWLSRAAPTLGEHNAQVLADLGCDDDEIRALAEAGVIGTAPLGT